MALNLILTLKLILTLTLKTLFPNMNPKMIKIVNEGWGVGLSKAYSVKRFLEAVGAIIYGG